MSPFHSGDEGDTLLAVFIVIVALATIMVGGFVLTAIFVAGGVWALAWAALVGGLFAVAVLEVRNWMRRW